jgi:ATP-dependent Clp protease ATP-binding subunit ClpC
MTDKDRRLYDKFDKTLSQAIVYAQAASIEAKIDCIYPESFMVGILTIGANEVTSTLVRSDVNLEGCLASLKEELIKKRDNNEVKGDINYDDLKLSKQVVEACKNANKIRTDILRADYIGVHHVFMALLRISDFLKNLFEKEGVTSEKFAENFLANVAVEGELVGGPKQQISSKSSNSALSAFCVDITKLAKENKLDPILARENEINTAITILCRRTKNNPILLGEPGVGKTAIVEGLAQRVISGTVPKLLLGSKVYSLSLSSLVAGTKYRGEFEERIQSLINEIQNTTDCILFIDEIHTLVGAGSAAGNALDASNILKPFLARSDLRCIGATTLDDYKKYFLKDGALARRFQQIMVEEPNKDQMKQILAGIKPKYEEYHKCIITADALDAVINLSDRYLKDRNFPDKAIDCLDMSCAKRAWETDKINKPTIVARDIAIVISEQCGIPIEVILWDDHERIIKIEEILSQRIIGQQHAVNIICKMLKSAYSGIRNPDRPIGSFVLGGQSGTGKTYTAKELAKAVFGKDSSFIRLDMTEFSEPHSVSKLIGSPPGYVGFHDVDVFTDKIRRKPYCLVLLDEMEKAHPDVIKLFLQVMSEGTMTDASGNKADFKNVVLIMTGNFGMDNVAKTALGFAEDEKQEPFFEAQNCLTEYCKNKYGAEFVNRVDEFVPFMPLSDEDLKLIIKIRLNEIANRIVSRHCDVEFSVDVYDLLIKMGKKEHGKNATILNRLISKKIEPCISDALISSKKDSQSIIIETKDDNFVYRVKKGSSREKSK